MKYRVFCKKNCFILIASVILGLLLIYRLLLYPGIVETTGGDYIKWVDFKVSAEAMQKACRLDIDSYQDDVHLDWIALLAYAGTKGGGEFNSKSLQYIEEAAQKFSDKEVTVESLKEEYKYFPYFYEAYQAVLGGMLGAYEIEVPVEGSQTETKWEKKYGLKAYTPIAKGFPYSDYDDFGASRTYGYKREHLGHDMMGQIGTPIIAMESGYIEAIGWNQYGGWRIGIRSFDKKRYYYYAHLRQNRPYAEGLEEGDVVTAGDVIGYMGHTGYSANENVNNIKTVHLHVGIELIFDESQKESNNEIWIDCYQIVRFLYANRSEVVRDEATKEWKRRFALKDPLVEAYKKQQQP